MRKRRGGDINREVFITYQAPRILLLTAQLFLSYMGHRFVGDLKTAEDLPAKKKKFTSAYNFRVTDFPKPSRGAQVKNTYFREQVYCETLCDIRKEITFSHTSTHTQ